MLTLLMIMNLKKRIIGNLYIPNQSLLKPAPKELRATGLSQGRGLA